MFLKPHSPTFHSLCSHPTLESLAIPLIRDDSEILARDFISNLQAPISELRLAFHSAITIQVDPLNFLQPIGSTLRILSLEGLVEFRYQGLQLPNVQSLALRVNRRPDPALLVSAFPNLREFLLAHMSLEYKWYQDGLETHRARNQAALRRLPNAWTQLDSLSGTDLSMFAMNLPCRVRCLELLLTQVESPGVVCMVLDALQPSVLKVSIKTEFTGIEYVKMSLTSMLNHIGNVTRLDLEIDLYRSEIDEIQTVVSSLLYRNQTFD